MTILSELSDEQIEKGFEELYKNEPNTGDIQEALMNRITALEKRVQMLEDFLVFP